MVLRSRVRPAVRRIQTRDARLSPDNLVSRLLDRLALARTSRSVMSARQMHPTDDEMDEVGALLGRAIAPG